MDVPAAAAPAPHGLLTEADRAAPRPSAPGTVLCAALEDAAVVELAGPDAATFLHAQCTADISGMSIADWRPGGICTPKGRLISLFDAWRDGDAIRLLLPAELAEPTVSHLRRFVLRSKVRIESADAFAKPSTNTSANTAATTSATTSAHSPADAGAAWGALGIFGQGAAAMLQSAGFAVPGRPWTCVPLEAGARLALLPSGAASGARFLLVAPRNAIGSLHARLPRARAVGSGYWTWSGIDAAVPVLSLATRELFLPQSLHLEVLGGVSFRKGCYPGQEIVARSQYLGRLRRRMALAHCEAAPAGSDVYHDSEPREAVGHVVSWAEAPGGGVDLLVECPAALAQQGTLRAGGREAPALSVRALPYELLDPTA
jgi:folate-binding protein YgfZ